MTRCACPCHCTNIVKPPHRYCRICNVSPSCRSKQGTLAAIQQGAQGRWGRKRR